MGLRNRSAGWGIALKTPKQSTVAMPNPTDSGGLDMPRVGAVDAHHGIYFVSG